MSKGKGFRIFLVLCVSSATAYLLGAMLFGYAMSYGHDVRPNSFEAYSARIALFLFDNLIVLPGRILDDSKLIPENIDEGLASALSYGLICSVVYALLGSPKFHGWGNRDGNHKKQKIR